MEMKWAPRILDALFCDRKDHLGIYHWYDKILEENKFRKLKPGEQMKVTFEHMIR